MVARCHGPAIARTSIGRCPASDIADQAVSASKGIRMSKLRHVLLAGTFFSTAACGLPARAAASNQVDAGIARADHPIVLAQAAQPPEKKDETPPGPPGAPPRK